MIFTFVMGFPGGSDGDSRESAYKAGYLKFNPWVGKITWRREWLPTPVSLPGEFHGQRSLAGYSSWAHKESVIIAITSSDNDNQQLIAHYMPGNIKHTSLYSQQNIEDKFFT